MDSITEEVVAGDAPKKKPFSKAVRWGAVLIALAVVSVFGVRWYIQLTTTVTTDNAKVSADLVSISAEVSGKLTDVLVQQGDTVQAGQLLAQVDDSQYQINAAQAEAAWEQSQVALAKLPNELESAQLAVNKANYALSAAQAQAASAQLAMEDSQRILDRNTVLFQEGAIPQETLDSCKTKYETAVQTWEAAHATVNSSLAAVADAQTQLDKLNKTGSAGYTAQEKQAKAAYDNARLSLSRTAVIAPLAGNVVKLSALKGQYISPGTSLCTLVNPERVWIIANIEEKKIGRIHTGDPVTIVVDAYPDQVFTGQVEEIAGATQASFSILPTENTSGNYTKVAQRLPVKISAAQSEGQLKPGMSAVVTIKVSR